MRPGAWDVATFSESAAAAREGPPAAGDECMLSRFKAERNRFATPNIRAPIVLYPISSAVLQRKCHKSLTLRKALAFATQSSSFFQLGSSVIGSSRLVPVGSSSLPATKSYSVVNWLIERRRRRAAAPAAAGRAELARAPAASGGLRAATAEICSAEGCGPIAVKDRTAAGSRRSSRRSADRRAR